MALSASSLSQVGGAVVCADCEPRVCWAGLQKCEFVRVPSVAGTGLRLTEEDGAGGGTSCDALR